MKKNFHILGWIVSLLFFQVAVTSPEARATAELDRKYALESVGFLRSWDNVDGLFADYVAASFKDYFSKQSRFVLQDLSKADSVLTQSKLPYNKVIEDADILSQMARATRSQTIIRTKIQKEGHQYRFKIEWLHSPGMEMLSDDTFVLEEPTDGQTFGLGDIRGAMQKALDRMIGKIPFVAHVTGRDDSSVTINVGENSELRKGDTLIIATLDEVKKHPLLKSIVDWRLTRTGKVEVEEVDERIAFARVIEEDKGRSIARFQKVVQVIPKKVTDAPLIIDERKEAESRADEPPKLGFATAGLWVGSFGREYSIGTGLGKTGGGLLIGAKADGQLWFTREWFGELGVGYGSAGYSQSDIASGAATSNPGGGSVLYWRLNAGYTYLITGDVFGPKGWLKVGYKSTSYGLPTNATELVAPISFKAFTLSLGGDLPIRGGWGAMLNLDFGVLTSAGHPVGSGFPDTSGGSDINFSIGGYYRLKSRIALRLAFDIQANSADLVGGGSVSQKVISVVPSLMYYF